ncbi:MAG: NTP transferase domain-containing protein [Ignavibacteriales bacterium]|nr:NTP transferase domain-containing protein [Ignavibacteriales bacterium]
MKTNPKFQSKNLSIAILAAGKGKRMLNPDKAKVMFELNNKPLLGYVVETALHLSPQKIILIIGWQKDAVREFISTTYFSQNNIAFVEQNEQLGTGHAVMQTEKSLADFAGTVLVLSGDVPMLSEKTLRQLLDTHYATNATATILTAELENPFGYGRIIHHQNGNVQKIVEEKDATAEEKKVSEINSGIYVFEKRELFEALKHITPNNAQQEYYLTDVFRYFWKNNLPVASVKVNDANEVLGVNTVDDLRQLEQLTTTT